MTLMYKPVTLPSPQVEMRLPQDKEHANGQPPGWKDRRSRLRTDKTNGQKRTPPAKRKKVWTENPRGAPSGTGRRQTHIRNGQKRRIDGRSVCGCDCCLCDC